MWYCTNVGSPFSPPQIALCLLISLCSVLGHSLPTAPTWASPRFAAWVSSMTLSTPWYPLTMYGIPFRGRGRPLSRSEGASVVEVVVVPVPSFLARLRRHHRRLCFRPNRRCGRRLASRRRSFMPDPSADEQAPRREGATMTCTATTRGVVSTRRGSVGSRAAAAFRVGQRLASGSQSCPRTLTRPARSCRGRASRRSTCPGMSSLRGGRPSCESERRVDEESSFVVRNARKQFSARALRCGKPLAVAATARPACQPINRRASPAATMRRTRGGSRSNGALNIFTKVCRAPPSVVCYVLYCTANCDEHKLVYEHTKKER